MIFLAKLLFILVLSRSREWRGPAKSKENKTAVGRSLGSRSGYQRLETN